MSTLARWRDYWLWWLLPSAALAVLLGWEIDWGRHIHRLPEPEPPVIPKPVAPVLLPEYRIEGGLASHSETVDRTLFNPTRRPAPVVTAADQAKTSFPHGQYQLTGTALAGEKNIAFLKEVAGGKSRVVRQGDQINGVLVAEVAPGHIKLTLADDSEEILLKVAPAQKVAAAPGARQAGQPATAAQAAAGAAPGTAAGGPVQRGIGSAFQVPAQGNVDREQRRAARAAAAAQFAAQRAAAQAAGTDAGAAAQSPGGTSGGVPGTGNQGFIQRMRRGQNNN